MLVLLCYHNLPQWFHILSFYVAQNHSLPGSTFIITWTIWSQNDHIANRTAHLLLSKLITGTAVPPVLFVYSWRGAWVRRRLSLLAQVIWNAASASQCVCVRAWQTQNPHTADFHIWHKALLKKISYHTVIPQIFREYRTTLEIRLSPLPYL